MTCPTNGLWPCAIPKRTVNEPIHAGGLLNLVTLRRQLKRKAVGAYQDCHLLILKTLGRSSLLSREISPGISMNLDISQRIQFIQWKRSLYEPHISKLAHGVLRPGDTAVDVGAHVGYFTLLFSSLVGPSGRIASFEPEPGNFQALSSNILKNSIQNVDAVNAGISSTTGTASLLLSETNEGGHSISEDGTGSRIEIKTISLDDYFESKKISTCRLIKIDAEGHEASCLEGMKNILRNTIAEHIVLEVGRQFPEKRKSIAKLLKEYGYTQGSFLKSPDQADSFDELHFEKRIQ